MKTVTVVVMVLAGLSFGLTADAAKPIVVANFDQGKMVTLWEGMVGEWYANPDSRTVASIAAADAQRKRDGRALKMVFDTTMAPHFSGVFMKLGPMGTNGEWPTLDATGSKAISLWVKGTARFGVEIKSRNRADDGLNVAKATVVSAGSTWRRVSIPYSKMSGAINPAAVEEIVFVFSDRTSGKRGVILVDEICVE